MANAPKIQPVELICFAGEWYRDPHIVRARLEAGHWRTQRLFPVYNLFNRDAGLSPDRHHFYYMAERTWIGDAVQGGRAEAFV